MKKVRAKIILYEPSSGGRKSPIRLGEFGCPVFFDDAQGLGKNGYDCRVMSINESAVAFPGEELVVDLVFLSERDVVPHIRGGVKFRLWEAGFIGSGVILESGARPLRR